MIKTYRVYAAIPESDTVLDLVNELDEQERYIAHPDDFYPGQILFEHDFVIRDGLCVTEKGLEECPVAYRLSSIKHHDEESQRFNYTVLIVCMLTIGIILSTILISLKSLNVPDLWLWSGLAVSLIAIICAMIISPRLYIDRKG